MLKEGNMVKILTESSSDYNNNFIQLPRKGDNIVAIASGKNGVGRTWFAIALTHAISLCRKKVLLFDADCGMDNINTQLGLSENDGLESAINGKKCLNQVVENYDKGHFDVISRKYDDERLSNVPVGRLQILGDDLCILADNYDKVVLDISAGIENDVRILSGMAKNIIVLCTPEPSSLVEAYKYIKIMFEQYSKNEFLIVINQVNSLQEGERIYELLQKACDDFLNVSIKLLGSVRRDTRVRDAIRNKVSVISRYPTAEVSEDVWMIAKKLVENE